MTFGTGLLIVAGVILSPVAREPIGAPRFSQVLHLSIIRLGDGELARLASVSVEPFEIPEDLEFNAMVAVIEQLAIELAVATPDGPQMFGRSRLPRRVPVCGLAR